MDSFHAKSAKAAFRFLSFIGSFSVNFHWDDENNIHLSLNKSFTLYIWYIQQLLTYISAPIFALSLLATYKDYVEHRKYAQLTLNFYFFTAFVMLSTVHLVFLQHREQVVGLVGQCLKLQKHFEKGKTPTNLPFIS